MRILDQFGISRDLMKRWDGKIRTRGQRIRPIK
jgi:hypothetical protein